jgi:uncharacterized protein (DUF2141 family)
MIAPLLLMASQFIASSPDLGIAAGRCRDAEHGPAFLVSVIGLKDRRGLLKLELYPDNDADFLADDNVLVMAGKTFRRVEMRVPKEGPVVLCIRAPGPGNYALSLLHDRDADRKFSLSIDGIGFAGNPKLGFSRPHAAEATAHVGTQPTKITVVLNYRRGLFSFGPLASS